MINELSNNELLMIWNENKNYVYSDFNEELESKNLKYTHQYLLKNGKIVSTRRINETDEYISLIYKTLQDTCDIYTIYVFVVFNLAHDFPPENSRIIKFCKYESELFDTMQTIIQFKLESHVNEIIKHIDEKLETILNDKFKISKIRIGTKMIDLVTPKEEKKMNQLKPSASSLNDSKEDTPAVLSTAGMSKNDCIPFYVKDISVQI